LRRTGVALAWGDDTNAPNIKRFDGVNETHSAGIFRASRKGVTLHYHAHITVTIPDVTGDNNEFFASV